VASKAAVSAGKLRLAPAAAAAAQPVLDPGRHDCGAARRIFVPAVVAAADFLDEARKCWLRGIDDGERLVVGEVDVIVADEDRRLARDFVVAGAAAIGCLRVRPEFLLEFQDVRVARHGPGVGRVARGRRLGNGVLGGCRTAAACGEHGLP
jgi:hypothetical protein